MISLPRLEPRRGMLSWGFTTFNVLLLLGVGSFVQVYGDQVLSRVVTTKYGKVQGVIRHHSRPTLAPIEVYLGVPYASPPIGEGRFTPTSSPLPWDHVRKTSELPPVCPQPLWDDKLKGLVPEDVAAYYSSIKPVLQNQNEDCLYLNIYAPHDGGGKFAVIVYIHGASFSWGSGNLYDGGTLASYGQVVVITVNYRLGPLGFLNTSPGGSRNGVVSNQGLMDQLAALSWVQENIVFFGGDPGRVTLVGHSTGAACVGYLLASPVLVPGLFRRAVLMSGSALSPWAEVPDALSVTVRLAKVLNCTVPSDLSRKHPETVACLRNVTFRQLVDAAMPQYKFASVFGPSVDGVVVPENFKERLNRVFQERRIDLLFGVTEGDAYPELTASEGRRGLSIAERNRIFRTFVRNTYQHHLQEIYLAVAKEYTDWENPSQHPSQVRDWTIRALSDGSFLAPLVRFADAVTTKSDTFMYVFTHHDTDKERIGSVFGSEVPLLFGAPFQDNHFLPSSHSSLTFFASSSSSSSSASSSSSPSSSSSSSSSPSSSSNFISPAMTTATNFSRTDALVSEYLMRYWTNFAKSGHPDLPDDTRPVLSFRERSKHKNVSWEMYDQVFEKYLEISSRPRLRDHYRAHKVALWNWLLPELEDAGSKYPEAESEIWHTSEDNKYFVGPVRPLDPFRFLHPSRFTPTPDLPPLVTPVNRYFGPNVSAAQGPSRNFSKSHSMDLQEHPGSLLDYTTALTLTVAIGLSLLVLNVILFAALLYKRERNNLVPKMKYDSVSSQPLCTVDSGLRSTPPTRGSITPPGKELQSSCSSSDQQCTELRTFPTPPDIGDRNTEVTFHNSSSVHSILSQPTSQFIPPPPLLSTTPPTPPVGAMTTEGIDSEACGQSRCFSDVGTSQFPKEITHYSSDPPSHYPTSIGETPYPASLTSPQYLSEASNGRYTDLQHVDQYVSTQQLLDGNSCSSVSSPCSFPQTSTQCPSGQFCSAQYTPNVSQYSTSSDQYSSSSPYSGSPCQQYPGGSNSGGGIRYYGEKSYNDDLQESPGDHISNGRSSRTSTLTRQSSGGGGQPSARKPQPSARVSAAPSYATLPRQEHKD